MPDRVPEDMPGRMPEDMPEDMPEHMPEDMPGRMPEDMPDRMPEYMSDRLPEDLPVTKFIMVGMTRSKVFFLCVFFFSYFLLKRGMSLERVWRFSKLSPNSLQTQMISFWSYVFSFIVFSFLFEKTNDFGVSLEILQTPSKLAPNSYVFIFSVFMLFSFYFTFLEKRNDILPEYVISGPICSM